MDNLMVPLELESLQDLNGESADQARRHPLEVVLFYEFIEVHAQKLE